MSQLADNIRLVLFAFLVLLAMVAGPAIVGLIVPFVGMYRLYLYVFTAGALVGVSELLTRHRDYPLLAAVTVPSLLYLITSVPTLIE
jgi:hypothetical protein